MLAKLNLGLGATCLPQGTTDYQLSLTGTQIPTNPTVLSTMDDVNELEREFAPFYPGVSPVVQEDSNPSFKYQYVDGTGRKVYTISYGGYVYNVGQTLNGKCNYPGGLWAVVNGRPMWVASQSVADSYNRAGQVTDTRSVPSKTTYTPLPSGGKVITATVAPSPQNNTSGNNSGGVMAGSTPSMSSNDGTGSSVGTNVPIGMPSLSINTWLLLGGALAVGYFMLKR